MAVGGIHRYLYSVVCLLFTLSHGQDIYQKPDYDDYKDHPCYRECTEDGAPKRCEYDWTLELYYAMSKACFRCPFNATDCSRPHCIAANGTPRGIYTANRIFPGPEINVCEGDQVVVTVFNDLSNAAGTTIHWHGMLQRGSQLMDGVPLVTQCFIPQLTHFQYSFQANDPGTHWWHSHSGVQRSSGLYGHLIVRQKASRDPHSALYDHDLAEHVISVTDWLGEMTESRFLSHHHSDGDNKPASMLINGKGAFKEYTVPETGDKRYTPYAEFRVKAGHRYRFRVISAAVLNCPIQISVDNHTLLVIASDGGSFDPVIVDSFNIFGGERYDFVLSATNTSSPTNHWIRARGLADCNVKKAHQMAVLRYEGAPPGLPTAGKEYTDGVRAGKKLNPLNMAGTDSLIPVDRLESTAPDDDTLKEVPDKKFYLAMDFKSVDNLHFNDPGLYPLSSVPYQDKLLTPQINHISLSLPPVPVLTQYASIDDQKQFCTPETIEKNCTSEYCECTHRLKVALGDVVEMVILDEGVPFNANHPMHLHGFKFRVIGLDRLNETTSLEKIKALDAQGLLRRKLTKAVLKDTVTIPDGGYTIIRFKADNPGVWLMHCHVEFHAAIGMGLVVQVGEHSDFPRAPEDFLRCGRFSATRSTCSNSTPTLRHSVIASLMLVVLGVLGSGFY